MPKPPQKMTTFTPFSPDSESTLAVADGRLTAVAQTDQVLTPCLNWCGEVSQESRWVPRHHGIRRHVAGDDATGPNDGVLADDHSREDRCSRPDRRALSHERWLHLPVHLGLHVPCRGRRARVGRIDEGDTVPDEDVVLDRHALADEGMTRDLAPTADFGILLNLDERANLRAISDFAAI